MVGIPTKSTALFRQKLTGLEIEGKMEERSGKWVESRKNRIVK
jgi:hypothetical protein